MSTAIEDVRTLKNSAKRASRARANADDLWSEHKALIKEVYAKGGMSLQDISDVTGVTKARIWQIVSDYRSK